MLEQPRDSQFGRTPGRTLAVVVKHLEALVVQRGPFVLVLDLLPGSKHAVKIVVRTVGADAPRVPAGHRMPGPPEVSAIAAERLDLHDSVFVRAIRVDSSGNSASPFRHRVGVFSARGTTVRWWAGGDLKRIPLRPATFSARQAGDVPDFFRERLG
ncbi:MAG TPA: hypothetical protein VF006_33590 [Longimicrobium sp.]